MKKYCFLFFIIFNCFLACTKKNVDLSNRSPQFIFENDNAFFLTDAYGEMVLNEISKKEFNEKPAYSKVFIKDEIVLLKQGNSLCKILINKDGLYLYKKDGKWGFKNIKGKVIIPAKFDRAFNFSEGLAAVKINYKWFFIDKAGKISDKSFDDANSFNGNFAVVKKDGKRFLIDKDYKIVKDLKYDYNPLSFQNSSNDYIIIEKLTKPSILIDKTGKVIVDESRSYSKIHPVQSGLFRFMKNIHGENLFGFINQEGKEIIPPQYEIATNFYEEIASVKTKEGWTVINKNGKTVFPLKNYQFLQILNPQTLIATLSDGSYNVMNLNGNEKTIFKKSKIKIYHNPDLIVVRNADSKLKFFDDDGKQIIDESFDNMKMLKNGCFLLQNNQKRGYADMKNKIYIKPIYDYLTDFEEETAVAVTKDKKLIISTENNVLKDISQYKSVHRISDLPFCRE